MRADCELFLIMSQGIVRDIVSELNSLLAKRGPRDGKSGWRDSEEYFRDPALCKEFAAGVLNLAVAWQMQGHEVSMFVNRGTAC